jgi:hypothetical protein
MGCGAARPCCPARCGPIVFTDPPHPCPSPPVSLAIDPSPPPLHSQICVLDRASLSKISLDASANILQITRMKGHRWVKEKQRNCTICGVLFVGYGRRCMKCAKRASRVNLNKLPCPVCGSPMTELASCCARCWGKTLGEALADSRRRQNITPRERETYLGRYADHTPYVGGDGIRYRTEREE